MMQKIYTTPVLESLVAWKPILEKVEASLSVVHETTEPTYINIWGGHGVGKTMLTELIFQTLQKQDKLRILGPWNVEKTPYSILVQDINSILVNHVEGIFRNLILLDNIDALTATDRLEFENYALSNIVQSKNTLIVVTSKSKFEWKDPTLRRRSLFLLISSLSQEDVETIASAWSLDPIKAYVLSLGQPQVLMWLKDNQTLTAEQIFERAFTFFLDGLTEPARELALYASLLPGFDLPALKNIIPTTSKLASLSRQELNDYFFELLVQGLVFHDEENEYYFYRYCDSAVRQLLALYLQQTEPETFKLIHKNASQYFQEEAKRYEYLPLVFLNVLYHLAQSAPSRKEASQQCLDWARKHLKVAGKEERPALKKAWNTGNGDSGLLDELRNLTNARCINQISALIG